MHPRNPHHGRYDFVALTQALPELVNYTIQNPSGEPTINFADNQSVLMLNKALLAHHYGIRFWDIPKGYLCPPIPSRADYIHHVADLLADGSGELKESCHSSDIDTSGRRVHVLDIGTGASCIYPIIGSQSYGWRFTATDIDPVAVNTAKLITKSNPNLQNLIKCKHQPNPKHIFKGIIKDNDYFDLTVCNPPFHGSLEDALGANTRKQSKLAKNRQKRQGKRGSEGNAINSVMNANGHAPNLNFGGQQNELWTQGGELGFVSQMIHESVDFAPNVGWFTSLISKADNLTPLERLLNELGATDRKVFHMKHGQKSSRILAWRFG